MITIDQAKLLKHGDIIHHVSEKNADGTPLRARPNGRIRLWKTRPKHFSLPMKHGFKLCFRLTHYNAANWELPDDSPVHTREPSVLG